MFTKYFYCSPNFGKI
ncbi:hypothetical protein BpHYR1_029034 [Brachionus plicatilis]|uniref:Uncharacterized protein n=1 Tax=Brachionus plicatilis TaxID=10195 RepID=A0A3M7SWB0_BRAPC|nr:hypothetical protein BpHYR1_029034 [Brachionus plicatilis]